jgi:hypothetical protein
MSHSQGADLVRDDEGLGRGLLIPEADVADYLRNRTPKITCEIGIQTYNLQLQHGLGTIDIKPVVRPCKPIGNIFELGNVKEFLARRG